MAQINGVSDIFDSMEINSEKVQLELAERWIHSNSDNYYKGIKYGKFAYAANYSSNEWHKKSSFERGRLLSRLGQNLKKNETLLAQTLCLSMYSYSDSKTIVNHLNEQFDFFSHYTYLIKDPEVTRCIVDVNLPKYDFPMLGQVLAPILASGFTLRVHTSLEFSHFFLILGELILEAGLPLGVLTIADEEQCFDNEMICIKNPHPNYYCPLLVFDDADLDSAVECIIQGAWRYLGKLSWSVTHVFAQESIYKIIIGKLKARSLKLKPGLRFDKNCDLPKENVESNVKGNGGDLEMFQPFHSCPQCFYIGWDPSEYEDPSSYFSQPNLGVTILPFRTKNEAVALANKSRFAYAASVWSERISTVKSVTKLLEFNTVWINSHGLIHPSIPLESQKETKLPINGKQLINALLNIPINNNADDDNKTYVWDKTKNILCASESLISKDICTAIERAKEANKKWMLKSEEDRLALLWEYFGVAQHLVESEIKEDFVNAIRITLIKARFSDISFTQTLGKMDVTCSWKPFGIIWIILSSMSPLIFEQLVILIFNLLMYGNSIIISAQTDELKRIACHICAIFEKCKLQKGLLNFVSGPFDYKQLFESGSEEIKYCKIINRFITFGQGNFRGLFGHNIEFIQKGINFFENADFLQLLSIQRKCVWTPNV